MSNLIISEEQYKRLFEEKQIITEDRQSKNMKMARNVVRQYKPDADAMQIITAIRNQIPNTRLLDCKFLPGVTQMFMKHEILDDGSKLNATLELIAKHHADEYNQMLNNETAENLINRFASEVTNDYENDVKAHNDIQWNENASYKIYRIESHKDAAWANDYTDWCITDREPSEEIEPEYDEDGDEIPFDPEDYDGETNGDDAYNNYTHNGLGLFYFCIQDGFDKLPKEQGEGCPLDAYGLSMIATSVDENGRCQTITCRWNHANGGNDHIMTPMELSKIIGRNYYQTFLPYTKEELKAKGKAIPKEVLKEIAAGEEPSSLFQEFKESGAEGVYIVKLNDMWNYYNAHFNQYLLPQWQDGVEKFIEGFAIVESWTLEICDYMRPDGSFLFNDGIRGRKLLPFNNGYSYVVYNGNRENNWKASGYIIDKNGKPINEQPFDFRASQFEFISDSLVKLVHNYYGSKDVDIKLFRPDGTPVLDGIKLKEMSAFNSGGLAEIMWNGDGEYRHNYGLIQKDGSLFMNKVLPAHPLRNGGYIFLEDEEGSGYILKPNGEPVVDMKFDHLWGLENDGWTTALTYKGKKNYLNVQTGQFLSDDWFDECDDWLNRVTVVKLNGKANIINKEGKYLLDTWYDDIRHSNYSGFPLIVVQSGKENMMNENGQMLDVWFDKITKPKHAFSYIGVINGVNYAINTQNMTYQEYTKEDEKADLRNYEDERWERSREYW